MRLPQLLLASLLSVQCACTRWVTQPVLAGSPPPASARFQIWSGDSSVVAHAIRVDRDTLYGITTASRNRHPSRLAIPMTEVDSMRAMKSIVENNLDSGLVAGLVIAGAYVALILAGRGN